MPAKCTETVSYTHLDVYKRQALTTLVRLAAPYVPFVTESIYQNLVRRVNASAPLSVHMADFPVCDDSLINRELEEHMQALLTVVGLGRSARNAAGMKNRQPLSRLFIQGEPLPERYTALIADELNVKAVEYIACLLYTSKKARARKKTALF